MPYRIRHHFIALAAVALLAGHAHAMTGDEVKAEKNRIEQEYKAAKARCDTLAGNAKDVCKKEAEGQEEVAEAELEVRRNDTPRNQMKLSEARADATYEVAKERCDDLSGNAKDVCQKDAKAAHATAVQEAKARFGKS